MKRSEFLKRLRLEGEKRLPYAWDYCEPKEILDIIESMGMLPPLNNKKADNTPSCFLKEFINCDEYYEWEPEDE